MSSKKWTRKEFQKWAQENANKPPLTRKIKNEWDDTDGTTTEYMMSDCSELIYGDKYRVPFPRSWCEDCTGRLPDYKKWKVKIWVPKNEVEKRARYNDPYDSDYEDDI